MENTYWNNKGTHQALADKLEKLVPDMGPCENKKVERFRKAANNYYDIFNNGGGNRGNSIGRMFPGVIGIVNAAERSRWNRAPIDWDSIYEITEPKMDAIILDVAKKVGLI